MRIQHNIMAMNAYRNYTNNVSAMKKNLEKLSSGYKINRAGDDAAGLAISEKMRAQITGLETAQKNAKDGISLVQTAEGALTEVHDMLNRMVTLATQSANGTYDNDTDRNQLQKEMDQLRSEINRIADSSNFNGIKLLDGSLGGSVTTMDVGGNVTSKASAGVAGAFQQSAAIAAVAANGAADGGTARFTVTRGDGQTAVIDLTVKKDITGTNPKYTLVANDGTTYAVAATTGAITQDEITNALNGELNKVSAIANSFSISVTGGQFTLTSNEVGTDPSNVISAYDFQADWANTGNPYTINTALGVTASTAPSDAGREIDASTLTEYTGVNYDDAVFTINGHKFVIMAENMDASTDAWFRATNGLGSDVTILVGGTASMVSGSDNWEQNIAKIAEVTGLKVGDTVTEATNSNGIDQGKGIRLSAGKSGGGLTLQIGDTADSFNQLKVNVNDCHTKALGIDNISIANQDSAAAAVDAIKKAINKVSDVRGTLGATQNRLDHTINNLGVMTENIQDAESTIRDVDVAEEMMAYTKNNILIQSAQAMLAQANQVPQGVLQLLQ